MKNISINDYIRILSSDLPAPGGGSACSVMSCIGISLGLMAINVSKKRKSFLLLDDTVQNDIENNIIELNKIIEEIKVLEEEDQKAFNEFMNVYKISEDLKTKAIVNCFNVPYNLFMKLKQAASIILGFKPYIVSSIDSDYVISINTIYECMKYSLINMEINLKSCELDSLKIKFKECENILSNEKIKNVSEK